MTMSRPASPAVLLSIAQGIVLCLVAWDLLRLPEAKVMLREGGGIETASAVLLALCALAYTARGPARRNWHVPVGLLLLAMRELDFDKRFTSEGVLQLRLYSGDNPVIEKIAGAAIVAVSLAVIARLLRFQLSPWLAGLQAPALWAWLFAGSAGSLIVAKTLDGFARKLAPWGIEISQFASSAVSRVEEVLELVFALGVLATIALAAQAGGGGRDAGAEADRS